VLLVLDTEVRIVGPAGPRRLPLDRFFLGPGRTALATGELLESVEIPRTHAGWTVRYERLDVRRAMDIAIVGVGLALQRAGARVSSARLALGAVAPTPLRVPEAEAALVEGGLAPAVIGRVAELAMAAARPISDVRATAEYRREMVGTLVRRALAAALTGG
jgi:carbon-monoxide dehydrogenase medium subunit